MQSFFYYEDIEFPLEDYVEDLKEIVFQEQLGSLYDKTIRVQKLAKKNRELFGSWCRNTKKI